MRLIESQIYRPYWETLYKRILELLLPATLTNLTPLDLFV